MDAIADRSFCIFKPSGYVRALKQMKHFVSSKRLDRCEKTCERSLMFGQSVRILANETIDVPYCLTNPLEYMWTGLRMQLFTLEFLEELST